MANLRKKPVSSAKKFKVSRAERRGDSLPESPPADHPLEQLPSGKSERKQTLFIKSSRRIEAPENDYDLRRFAERDAIVAELRVLLHGDERCGAAFRKLVDEGCDEAWLESLILHSWYRYPWKSSRNPLGEKQRQNLLVSANILRRQAMRISPVLHLLVGVVFPHDPSAANELAQASEMLRGLSKNLMLAHDKSKGRRISEIVASRMIPNVIQEIRRITGRPHFAEMATLYSETYRRDISVEELRTMESREKVRLNRASNRSGGKNMD